MSYRRFTLGLFLLLLVFACTKKLSKNELADVLVDIYIYDQLSHRTNLHLQDSVSIYRSVFQKHNCTAKQFQASMMYYSANPKHLKEVYTEADKKIKLLKKDYGDVVDALHKERALQRKMDSLYRYPHDSLYRHIFKRCLLFVQEFDIETFGLMASDSLRITPDAAIVDTEVTVAETDVTPALVPKRRPIKAGVDIREVEPAQIIREE